MKDKIIEILNSESFSIIYEEGQGFEVIESDDFEDVADRIMKILNNNKIKSFCRYDRNDCQYQIENKECKYSEYCCYKKEN